MLVLTCRFLIQFQQLQLRQALGALLEAQHQVGEVLEERLTLVRGEENLKNYIIVKKIY